MRTLCVALGMFMVAQAVPLQNAGVHARQEMPSYAKWGKLAIEKTQSSYPNAQIIDYLHEGSELYKEATIEKFKLWLKEGDNEFGVYVRIRYITETQEMIAIELMETAK